jgi:hypothetical protein
MKPTIYLPSAVAARVIPRCLKRLGAQARTRAPGVSRAPLSGYSWGPIGSVSGRLLAISSSVSARYG